MADRNANEGKLRIIHCFRSPVGGIFRHVRDLAEHHSAEGHEVGILCDSTTGGDYEDRLFDGIRPHLALGLTRIPIRRAITPADLRGALESYQTIRKLQPDILHGHGAKGGAYARIVGSRLRVSGYCVARFYSPHGGSLHFSKARPSGRLFFGLERLLERATDRIVFVSDYEKRTYGEKVGAPAADHVTIHNGLRPHEFEPVEASGARADFLYIGMMRDLKGPDVFIEAFIRAERRVGRPLSAVMVGDGDDKPRYRATLEKSGIANRVSLHPAMPAREAFALARTVVVPSRAESMTYIVLEAVAGGMPVIATRVGGIPEILGADCPAMVPPGDAEPLCAMMARTVSEPEWLAAAMPRRIDFERRFSAAHMAERMAAGYRDVLSRLSPEGTRKPAESLS
jgi:glycosyltransferase involved in cell wall biosynthesis